MQRAQRVQQMAPRDVELWVVTFQGGQSCWIASPWWAHRLWSPWSSEQTHRLPLPPTWVWKTAGRCATFTRNYNKIRVWPLSLYLKHNHSLTWLVCLAWGTWNSLIKNLEENTDIFLISGSFDFAQVYGAMGLYHLIRFYIAFLAIYHCLAVPQQLLLVRTCFCFGPSKVKLHHLNAMIRWQIVRKKLKTIYGQDWNSPFQIMSVSQTMLQITDIKPAKAIPNSHNGALKPLPKKALLPKSFCYSSHQNILGLLCQTALL